MLVVSPARIELADFRLGGERSIQLSYEDIIVWHDFMKQDQVHKGNLPGRQVRHHPRLPRRPDSAPPFPLST